MKFNVSDLPPRFVYVRGRVRHLMDFEGMAPSVAEKQANEEWEEREKRINHDKEMPNH